MPKPKYLQKILFWIVLGFLSTFFAEVLSGSAPDFLFKAFGYFGILPIYLLHSLLLAALVIRKAQPYSLRTLYLASLLFGMYEAYITKVLWSPPWNAGALKIAHLALSETLLLVFFWHSIFSFILPLFWIESLSVPSPRLPGLLPEKWQARLISPRGALLTGLAGGWLAGSAIGNPQGALLYVFADCLTLSLLLMLLRRSNQKQGFDLESLLPRKMEAAILAFLLMLDYLLFGLYLRREVQPGLSGHAVVLLLYGMIVFLMIKSMRKDKQQVSEPQEFTQNNRRYTLKNWFSLCAGLAVSALTASLLPEDARNLLVGLILLACTLLGVVFFTLSLISLFRKNKTISS